MTNSAAFQAPGSRQKLKIQIKNYCFLMFLLGLGCGFILVQLGAHLGQLGSNLARLGPTWDQMAPTWPLLGPTLSQLGPSWPQLGQTCPNLAPTWTQLGLTWPNLAPVWRSKLDLWRSCWLLGPRWSEDTPRLPPDSPKQILN